MLFSPRNLLQQHGPYIKKVQKKKSAVVFAERLIGGLLLIDDIGKMAEWLIHTLTYIHGGPLLFTGVYQFMHELTITLGSRWKYDCLVFWTCPLFTLQKRKYTH